MSFFTGDSGKRKWLNPIGRWTLSDPCEQYLKASATLIVTGEYREFTVLAFDGIDPARQATRLRDILNKMDNDADTSGLSSSVSAQDCWYVAPQINHETMARVLYCKHEIGWDWYGIRS